MRVLRAAAMTALLVAGPAYAQKGPAGAADPPKSPSQIEAENRPERAYKNSLGNIPDQPPADPWGGARAVEAPKSASKDTAAKRTRASGSTNLGHRRQERASIRTLAQGQFRVPFWDP